MEFHFVGPLRQDVVTVSVAQTDKVIKVAAMQFELAKILDVRSFTKVKIFFAGREMSELDPMFINEANHCYTYTIENTEIETVTFRDKSGTGDDVEVELPRQISVYGACGVISDHLRTDCDNIILFDGDRVLPWWSECCFNMDLSYLVESREEVSIHVDRCPGFSIKNKRLGREGRSFTVSNCSTVDDLKSLLRPKHPQSVVIMELVDSRHYVVLAGNRRLCRYHNGILYCAFVSHKVVLRGESKIVVDYDDPKQEMTYAFINNLADPEGIKSTHELCITHKGMKLPTSFHLLYVGLNLCSENRLDFQYSYIKAILFNLPGAAEYTRTVKQGETLDDVRKDLQRFSGTRVAAFKTESGEDYPLSTDLYNCPANMIRVLYHEGYSRRVVYLCIYKENGNAYNQYTIDAEEQDTMDSMLARFSEKAKVQLVDIVVLRKDGTRVANNTPIWSLDPDTYGGFTFFVRCKYNIKVYHKRMRPFVVQVWGWNGLRALRELDGCDIYGEFSEMRGIISEKEVFAINPRDTISIKIKRENGMIETGDYPILALVGEISNKFIIKVNNEEISKNMFIFSVIFKENAKLKPNEVKETVFVLEPERDLTLFFKLEENFLYKFTIAPSTSVEELIGLASATFCLRQCKFKFKKEILHPSSRTLKSLGIQNDSVIEIIKQDDAPWRLAILIKDRHQRSIATVDFEPEDRVSMIIEKLNGKGCSELFKGETSLPYDASVKDIGGLLSDRLWAHSDMKKERQKYEKRDLINKGRYGYVHRVISDGHIYAMKETYGGSVNEGYFHREVEALQEFDHPCIIKLIDWMDDTRAIVMEYAHGGDLQSAMQKGSLSATEKMIILADIAFGMDEVHKRQFIHRDLKPENILLDGKNHGKIGDLGLMRRCDQNMTFRAGTPFYMSPEQMFLTEDRRVDYDRKVDVYAFGMIAYQLLTGVSREQMLEQVLGEAFDKKRETIQSNNWRRQIHLGRRPAIPEKSLSQETIYEHARDMITLCWSSAPAQRPEFDEILHVLEQTQGSLIDGVDTKLFMAHFQSMKQQISGQ